MYTLDREPRKVVTFNVSRRTNRTLSVVLQSLFLSKAKMIYTDKLKNYRYLISRKIHRTVFRSANHIERHNLTLRIHLKRLNRKTICYSRSLSVLTAIIRIYLWLWLYSLNHHTTSTTFEPWLHYLSGMRWDKVGVFCILWISESTNNSISCFTLR